jgi:hypothetical protein
MFFHPKEKFGLVIITNGCDPAYADGFNIVIRKPLIVCMISFIWRK